jgi:hypothetical protein
MITYYFNNQIYKNEMQAHLFGVGEVDLKSFEEHEVEIQNQLYYLVQYALEEKEDPIALIEDFLHVQYTGGDTINEFVTFLCNTHFMVHAFDILKENWNNLDESVPGDSLLYANAELNEQKGFSIYLDRTLRSYLESLSQIYHG